MMWMIALLACGGTPEAQHEHGPGTHEHGTAEKAAEPHDHAGHHAAGGDHMALMAATRDQLRTDLGAAYDQPVAGLDSADKEAGKSLYSAKCASCHGDDGRGRGPASAGLNPPAADFTDAFHARYYSDAGRVRIIEKGSSGTAMVGFEGQLSSKEILDVYAYVAAFRGDSGADAGHGHPH